MSMSNTGAWTQPITKSACSKSSNSTNKKASASYPYIPPTNHVSTPCSGQNSPSSATSSPRHQRANASQHPRLPDSPARHQRANTSQHPRPPNSPARHQRANGSQPKTTKPDTYRPHRPPQLAFLKSAWKLNSPIVGQKHIGAVAEALRKVPPPPREHLFPNGGAALAATLL